MIIYKTTNLITGKFYVGKDSKNLPNYLGSGVLLNAAIKKYGRDNFIKEILESVHNIEELDSREIYWINKLNSTDRHTGYNLTNGGTGGDTYSKNPNYDNIISKLKKRRHTEETKKKISANNWQHTNPGPRTGSNWGEDQRKKMENYWKNNPHPSIGKTHTEASKQKMREKRLGKKCSEETKAKMREKAIGRKASEETRAKLREKRLGKKCSEETRAKLREKAIGRKASEETKAKMREKAIGRKASEETKEKIRAVMRHIHTCSYCGKEGAGNIMFRHHFNNCKNKKDN